VPRTGQRATPHCLEPLISKVGTLVSCHLLGLSELKNVLGFDLQ
jgi:hypothetical protein